MYVRSCSQLVASTAVVSNRLLRFPVTVEARRMIGWRGFEACRFRNESVGPCPVRRFRDDGLLNVADRTVVKRLPRLIHSRLAEQGPHKDVTCIQIKPVAQRSDNVLMFVVWKLDSELKSVCRITKRQSRIISRRYSGMTNGADGWPITFKKLWPMTTDTGRMSRIVSYVRVGFCFLPLARRNFMTGVAGCLMFISSVREL